MSTTQNTEQEEPPVFLMEKTWERIQKKTFTGWINAHLRKKGLKISDIVEDLKDGLNLQALLHTISGEDWPSNLKMNKKPKFRIQKVGNVNQCLNFITEKGVKLVGIGAPEIVDGNLKLTLGMIWTIILRFAIADISESELSAREALLLWVQKKTKGYKDVDVKNFHRSFQDGLALCALIHAHRPDLIPYNTLSKENKKDNLNMAFEAADKHLDIPKILDAEDIADVPKPDEKSIITYVSMLYKVFAKGQEAEVAGRRVAGLVDFTSQMDEQKANFNERSSGLTDWIKQKN